MITAHCDKCEKAETIRTGFIIPKGWADITVTGQIPTKERGLSRQSFKQLLCDTCVKAIFDTEASSNKTVEQTFREVAGEYLNDLAIDAFEQAAENM